MQGKNEDFSRFPLGFPWQEIEFSYIVFSTWIQVIINLSYDIFIVDDDKLIKAS